MDKRLVTLSKLGYKRCVIPKSAEKLLTGLDLEGLQIVGCRNLKEVIHSVFVLEWNMEVRPLFCLPMLFIQLTWGCSWGFEIRKIDVERQSWSSDAQVMQEILGCWLSGYNSREAWQVPLLRWAVLCKRTFVGLYMHFVDVQLPQV